MTNPIRLTHIIMDLEIGGAQVTLLKLLSTLDRRQFDLSVISLTDVGSIGAKIADLGIPVHAVGMRPGKITPVDFVRLFRQIKALKPHLVQTWLYHSDLIGGLAARLAGVPVVWNVRSSYTARPKRSTLAVRRCCALLSGWAPSKIVTCALVAERVHVALGYQKAKMVVIPNGYDTDLYKPDASARESVRRDLGIPADAPVIGCVARFHPQKDHRTFLEACVLVRREIPECRYVLCGGDVTMENPELAAWVDELGLGDRVHLMGPRDDTPRLYAAMDVLALSSLTEAFPNAVAEAMSCGVPCAVTDVGDAAYIVGKTGVVVPPGDSRALAAACIQILNMQPEDRAMLGTETRKRVRDDFSLHAITARYETLYQELAGKRANC